MATKLGAVAKCVLSELLYGCRGGWSEIKSLHLLEVSSLVLTDICMNVDNGNVEVRPLSLQYTCFYHLPFQEQL